MVESRWAIAIVVRTAHQHVQRVANEQLGVGVDARRRLVQDQHRGIRTERPRKRQQLLLPHRQRRTTLGPRVTIAKRQAIDETVRMHCLEAHVERSASSIASSRQGATLSAMVPEKQVHVLQHHAEDAAKRAEIHLADVHIVDGDPPLLHVVETQQQVHDGGLARPVAPNDPDPLTGLVTSNGHVLEHRLAGT
jgi:hypothetical protein